MVVFTDDTLKRVEKRSPLDRKTLADALTAIDAMNPKAIGIDILIDQPQAEDPLLIDAFNRLKTPTYLAFASNATNPEYMQVWQEEYLTSFLQQIRSGPVRPTSIMLRPDPDNVMRSWPDQPATLPPVARQFADADEPRIPRTISAASPSACPRARNIRSSRSCRSTCSSANSPARCATRSRAATC